MRIPKNHADLLKFLFIFGITAATYIWKPFWPHSVRFNPWNWPATIIFVVPLLGLIFFLRTRPSFLKICFASLLLCLYLFLEEIFFILFFTNEVDKARQYGEPLLLTLVVVASFYVLRMLPAALAFFLMNICFYLGAPKAE